MSRVSARSSCRPRSKSSAKGATAGNEDRCRTSGDTRPLRAPVARPRSSTPTPRPTATAPPPSVRQVARSECKGRMWRTGSATVALDTQLPLAGVQQDSALFLLSQLSWMPGNPSPSGYADLHSQAKATRSSIADSDAFDRCSPAPKIPLGWKSDYDPLSACSEAICEAESGSDPSTRKRLCRSSTA
jgi:hypothetical protein